MRTTWKVTEVRMVEGRTTATLERGQWFKKNPEYEAMMDRYRELQDDPEITVARVDEIMDEEWPDEVDEFVDLEAPEQGADWVAIGDGTLALDITEGIELRPGDPVVLTIDVLDRVPS